MRIRVGFVSNSSSSSFVLDGSQVSPEQLMAIQDPAAWLENAKMEIVDDSRWGRQVEEFGWIDEPWNVDIHEETRPVIRCYTPMDKF